MTGHTMHVPFLMILFFSVFVCNAQTNTEKFPPKPPLKIIFDDGNAQLIGIDTNGKVIENAIIAFQLFVNIKGKSYSEQALGSTLSKSMQALLEKAEPHTILYFEHIQVKNTAGALVEAENFQYNLGYLKREK